MRKEVTTTIPAVEAVTKTEVMAVCDFCPTETVSQRVCMCCGRDICNTHSWYDPEEIGDYGGFYCPTCMKLFRDKYEEILYEIQDAAQEEEGRMFQEMKEESLNGKSL